MAVKFTTGECDFKSGLARSLAASVFGFCIGTAVVVAGTSVSGANAVQAFNDVLPGTDLAPRGRPASSTVDGDQMAALIKSTITAIHHANQTGNYSVLRDLGTPGFRERFDQARLTTAFARLRSSCADLSPVLSVTPSFKIDIVANELRLAGDLSTKTLLLRYDLAFTWIGNQWRIERLAIDTALAEPIPSALDAAPSVPQSRKSS
jgi:hypothetical protein